MSLGSESKDFREDEMSEILSNGTVYDFSVDYRAIAKRDVLNIHECLIKLDNIK